MMVHKAFLFDYESFERELRMALEVALESGECTGLLCFINDNRARLKDPNEGEPLAENWMDLIETEDAHQFGDFALTKFYDPRTDIGLGAQWEAAHSLTCEIADLPFSPLLGGTLGPPHDPFDPGKCGSYFQSAALAAQNYAFLQKLAEADAGGVLTDSLTMLRRAVQSRTGLYVTF